MKSFFANKKLKNVSLSFAHCFLKSLWQSALPLKCECQLLQTMNRMENRIEYSQCSSRPQGWNILCNWFEPNLSYHNQLESLCEWAGGEADLLITGLYRWPPCEPFLPSCPSDPGTQQDQSFVCNYTNLTHSGSFHNMKNTKVCVYKSLFVHLMYHYHYSSKIESLRFSQKKKHYPVSFWKTRRLLNKDHLNEK